LGTHVEWTETQRKLVKELIKAINEGWKSPLKRAAEVCRMSYNTAKNHLYKMRNRHDDMRKAVEQFSKWRRQIKGRRYL